LNGLLNSIKDIQGAWQEKLNELVEEINQSFSRNFKEIQCQGEVVLERPDDIAAWAIDIRVKFRSDAAQRTLNARLQSGGERSVATMLYLIALQSLTSCPFRLVDAINQAMDQTNERMIFDVVAAAACRPNLPQYFLITPKLLPDLNFRPEMTILNVFNGSWMLEQSAYDTDRFLDVMNKRARKS